MNKKLLLFLALALFAPIAKAGAINTYVGVQITGASTTNHNGPGSAADSNWCLTGGGDSYYPGTKMTIYGGTGCDVTNTDTTSGINGNCSALPAVAGSGTSNPPAMGPNTPVCPGSSATIWSGLVDLSNSTQYVIGLYTPNYCPGVLSYKTGAQCWVTSGANQNCSQVCGNYGLAFDGYGGSCYNRDFGDCSVIKALTGASCATTSAGNNSSCSTGSPTNCCFSSGASGYNYTDTNGNCYYASPGWPDCNAPGAGLTRACECYALTWDNNFYFTFTPTSL